MALVTIDSDFGAQETVLSLAKEGRSDTHGMTWVNLGDMMLS